MTLLQLAFVLDAAVTAPLAIGVLAGQHWAARLLMRESASPGENLRLTLGCLWLAIALCSLLGVFFPITFAAVLVLQLIYKTLWILIYAIPRWIGGRGAEVPGSVATVFLAFVLVYPWLLPWSKLFA